MAWTLLPCAEHVAPTAAAEAATLKQ
eukprot:COSAG01_NODE_8074_length_2931_cov_7.801907_3_plen_25_part_01